MSFPESRTYQDVKFHFWHPKANILFSSAGVLEYSGSLGIVVYTEAIRLFNGC